MLLEKIQSNSYHDLDISNALKRVVDPPICHLHQHLLDGPAVVFRVDKLTSTKLLGLFKLCWVDIHTDDLSCPSNLAAHNNSQANSSKTKNSTGGTRLNLDVKKKNIELNTLFFFFLDRQTDSLMLFYIQQTLYCKLFSTCKCYNTAIRCYSFPTRKKLKNYHKKNFAAESFGILISFTSKYLN